MWAVEEKYGEETRSYVTPHVLTMSLDKGDKAKCMVLVLGSRHLNMSQTLQPPFKKYQVKSITY